MKNQKKPAKKKKKAEKTVWWIVAAGILIVAASTVIAYFGMARPEIEDPVVATVNGEPVTFDEMTMVMGNFRVETAAYFFSRYGLEFTQGFWETEVDGTTPLEYIKEKALDFLVEKKVQQQFIRRRGLIGDFSHSAFLKALETENARRGETIAQGGVVYGVERFDPMTYYDYLFINQVQSLLTERGDELFPVSYSDIERFYEENKSNFKLPDNLFLDAIIIPLNTADEDPYEKALRAEQALLEGRDFDSVMREFNPDNEPYRVDLSGVDAQRAYDGIFADMAWGLSEGEVSVIFEWRGTWVILKCAERIPGGYTGIEGREHSILVEVRWEMYDAFAEQLKKEARVRIQNKAFDQLTMI
ncbi:MAG: peptidyl-prolyl cis-trans isomerase [Oscillospiraceae bacterium]|nr:peptidyl-prolyl cis-trans isomerase [Oscillospiraceae bacterium]